MAQPKITKTSVRTTPKSEPKKLERKTKFDYKLNKKYAKEEIVDAQKWFKEQIRLLATDTKKYKMSDLRLRTSIPGSLVGSMLFYKYDPKYKETLPYYDTFPVAIIIGEYPDGWLGLNIHYLPPNLRIILLGKLLDLANNTKFDKSTKIMATYDLLSKTSKYRYFRPCVKRYLHGHVVSMLQIIRPEQWHRAIMLPVARFRKASESVVWAESKRKISDG
jgi:hypothetical protein